MASICRWGFLSTAGIGRKNWKAIFHAENATVAAVASRDIHKARSFIAENQANTPFASAPVAYGDYESLIADPNIDAIYVPLPTALRKQWVIAAAEAGKHVLCEKPCASNLAELKMMIDACRKNDVQFMDGVMFMHSARLPAMKAVLHDENRIGKLRRIGIQFSFCGPDSFFQSDIRTHSQMEPQGCLGDLGWYCIRMMLWAMDGKLPLEVFRPHFDRRQTTSQSRQCTSGIFCRNYFLKVMSPLHSIVRSSPNINSLSVFCGSKGYVQVDDFVLPYLGGELSF
jgi:predicted dehydrogenase